MIDNEITKKKYAKRQPSDFMLAYLRVHLVKQKTEPTDQLASLKSKYVRQD